MNEREAWDIPFSGATQAWIIFGVIPIVLAVLCILGILPGE